MWFSRKKQPPIRSLIGEGTAVHGELRFSEGLRVDGEVIGDVIAAGDGASLVVISENARIMGKVIAGQSGKRHGMRKRSQRMIRSARGTTILNESDATIIRKNFLPNG